MFRVDDEPQTVDAEQGLGERLPLGAGFEARAASVVVVGSGVVGTATGRGLAANGVGVTFCDTSADRRTLLREQGLDACSDTELASHRPDAYLISVPTPTLDGRVDLSYIESAMRTVGDAIGGRDDWCCVVIRSTVPPGTTEALLRPLLEAHSGKLSGWHFGLAMNPEFLRAATALEDFVTPRVIVIGALDERSDEAVRRLYVPWGDVPKYSMDLRTAEATKYVSNLFNATKISFFNEMHRVLRRIGADDEVAFAAVAEGAEGMWNPRYGTRGGFPYGGVCLPKDTVGFESFARDLGEQMPLLSATIQVNEQMVALGEAAGAVIGLGGAHDSPAGSAAATWLQDLEL